MTTLVTVPILPESDVTKRVLDEVQAGRKQLVLPRLVRVLPVLRVLPIVAFDALADLLGIDRSMDHFVGRGR